MIALYQLQYSNLLRLPVPLAFSFFALAYLDHPRSHQDLVCVIFLITWNLSSLLIETHKKEIAYTSGTLSDTRYLAYINAFIERMSIERIPALKHKVFYSLLVLLAPLVVSPPQQDGFVTYRVILLALSLYLDFSHERYHKDLFFSYSNYKNQLIKFKDLVVHDIPESIAIISRDLGRSLFVNRSFKGLLSNNAGCIKDHLKKFIIQDPNKSIDLKRSTITDDISTRNLSNLLQESFSQWSRGQKLSMNLIYYPEDNPHGEDQEASSNSQGRLFEVKAFPIFWDEEPSIALIMHDVTQQHTILSLKIADANKDMVLATVSHELRTPLNGMLGMIQLVQKRVNDKEMMHYLSICKNSGDLLLGLVNSILDLNQIRSKKLKLNAESVKVQDLIMGVVSLFEFQCQQKKIYLKVKMSAQCPKTIITDKNRLTQIFINLVGNALKFTLEGGITLIIDEAGPDYLKFSVKDTGIGIKEQDRDKLFQRFGRLDHDNDSLNKHGVGLGLSISNQLAKLLSCSQTELNIVIESVFGKGSTFSFVIKRNLNHHIQNNHSLVLDGSTANVTVDMSSRDLDNLHEYSVNDNQRQPAYYTPTVNNFSVFRSPRALDSPGSASNINFTEAMVNNQPDRLRPRRAISGVNLPVKSLKTMLDSRIKTEEHEEDRHGPCVLIVDDNPFNVVVAEKLVISNGYKVKTVFSGSGAIKILQESAQMKEPIRLVLMDCQMPGMDGYEASRRIRKMVERKEIPDVKIVALTANDSMDDRLRCQEAGMCEHLAKPVKDLKLKEILRKFAPFV